MNDTVITQSPGILPGAFARATDWLGRQLLTIGSGTVMIMAALICIDVLGRKFLNLSIPGLIEIETILLTVIIFLGLPYTTSQDGHVSVDLLTNKFSPKLSNYLKFMFSLVSTAFCAIVFWQYILRTGEGFALNEATLLLEIPEYPFYFITAVGFGLTAVIFFQKLLFSVKELSISNENIWLQTGWLILLSAIIFFVPSWMKFFPVTISPAMTGLIFIAGMVVLLFLGYPVAFSMGFVGLLGTWYLNDLDLSLNIIRMSVYHSVSNYFFIVIPFFVFMGFVALKAGMTEKLYRAGNTWFGRLPGGLAIGTIFGCGGFAAICGDSMATAATMGSAALPEMKKYNYDDSIATGAVAAGGTLGILIPPSVGLIIYAIITEQSVAKLFAAGVLPGILLVLLFALAIYIQCKLRPHLGPRSEGSTWQEKISSLKDLVPVFGLFMTVVGGIYLGVFTPTEGGGIGVIGALLIYLVSGKFSWKGLMEAAFMSLKMSVMIFTILIGVEILGYFITLTNIPNDLANFIGSLNFSRYAIYVIILLLYLFLGMVMNIVPMIMLTLPIIFPTVLALGFDPIWFGIIMVLMMEMGQITPPMGINVFIISGVAKDVSMATIFKGIVPFVIMEIITIIILTIFPDIVMFLPNSMDVLPAIGGG